MKTKGIYQIHWGRNGQFTPGNTGTITNCKKFVRACHAGSRLYWQDEGDRIAAYETKIDFKQKDLAIARIYKI